MGHRSRMLIKMRIMLLLLLLLLLLLMLKLQLPHCPNQSRMHLLKMLKFSMREEEPAYSLQALELLQNVCVLVLVGEWGGVGRVRRELRLPLLLLLLLTLLLMVMNRGD